MAVLSLPLTFSNSFWTEDYRKGLEVLYKQLEQVRADRSCVSQFGTDCHVLRAGNCGEFRDRSVHSGTRSVAFSKLQGALTLAYACRRAQQLS